MFQICPAILTNNIQEFERELNAYSKYFTLIDVDINVEDDSFEGKVTAHIERIKPLIEKSTSMFNFHLMTTDPSIEISQLDTFVNSYNFKYIIHQESNLDKEIFTLHNKKKLGVAVKADSDLMDLDFYNKFSEIQFMTIDTGFQGNSFREEILERVNEIKEIGYLGKISIDGGINLASARFIKDYPVDRLSVGSYFSKSENIKNDLQSLENALNN